MDIKPIAIHLPQFHPIAENDAWWGKGFTEWTNVTKAKPRFKEHYQPHLPSDLGFYDLRLEEARMEQEKLAKKYGIFGFCYYHYWFDGKRLLNEPVDRKLTNANEDLPFMLCWANENWTKAWDGRDKDILLAQNHSDEDDIKHINHLIKYFKDPRYIRQNGNPVFIVYRPNLFPDIKHTTKLWREEVKKHGIDNLHLGYMQSFGCTVPPEEMGFDFAIEFQPNFSNIPEQIEVKNKTWRERFFSRKNNRNEEETRVYNYEEFVDKQINQIYNPIVSPCVNPMWDNSARKESAFILHDSSPKIFGKWLNNVLTKYPWNENKEKFLFINAWNEWAEGNHLEPCQKWGNAYLEELKSNLLNMKSD